MSKGVIFQVIESMEREKLLVPDGFLMVIYKKCWNFMKNDIMEVANELKDKAFFLVGGLTTLLFLLSQRRKSWSWANLDQLVFCQGSINVL